MEDIIQPLIELVKQYGIWGVGIIVFVVLAWRAIPSGIAGFVEDRKDRRFHKREREKLSARIERLPKKREQEEKKEKQG